MVNEILVKAGLKPVNDDIEFVKRAEKVVLACGQRPIELCRMTRLIQSEGKNDENEKVFKNSFENLKYLQLFTTLFFTSPLFNNITHVHAPTTLHRNPEAFE